jgi:hypothetical protein
MQEGMASDLAREQVMGDANPLGGGSWTDDPEFAACRDPHRARELVRAWHERTGTPVPESRFERRDGRNTVFATDALGIGTILVGLIKQPGFIGLDLETTALEPQDGLIRLVQVARGNFTGVIDCFYVDPTQAVNYAGGLSEITAYTREDGHCEVQVWTPEETFARRLAHLLWQHLYLRNGEEV